MINKLLQANREYQETKEKAVEQTVNNFESKSSIFFVILSFILLIFEWLYAVFFIPGFAILYDVSEFYAFIGFFITSYFFFFLGSKLLFKPSAEELSDDTSMFALFSACGRKAMRSFISVWLGLFHTLIITLYLMNKDLGLL